MHNDNYLRTKRKKLVRKIDKAIYGPHTPAAQAAASKRDQHNGK